jgi:hypothetical protein
MFLKEKQDLFCKLQDIQYDINSLHRKVDLLAEVKGYEFEYDQEDAEWKIKRLDKEDAEPVKYDPRNK